MITIEVAALVGIAGVVALGSIGVLWWHTSQPSRAGKRSAYRVGRVGEGRKRQKDAKARPTAQ